MLRITALTMEDDVISLNNTQTTQLAWLHYTTFGIPRPGPGRRIRIKIKICPRPEQIQNVGYCLMFIVGIVIIFKGSSPSLHG